MEEQQRRQLCDLLFEVKQKLTDKEYKDMMETLKKPKPVNIEGATLVKLTYEEHTYPDLEPLWDNFGEEEPPRCLIMFNHRLMEVEEKVSICEVKTDMCVGLQSIYKAKIHPKGLLNFQKSCEKRVELGATPGGRFILSDLCAIVPKKIEVLQRK